MSLDLRACNKLEVYFLKSTHTYLASLLIWLLSAFFALPLLYVLLRSFAFSWTWPDILPSEWSGMFWADVLKGSNGLGNGLALSIATALFTAFLATSLALPVSRAIAEHRHRRYWLLMAYFPFILAPVIYATTLRFFFVKMGLSSTLGGIMLGHFLIAFPFAVLVLEGGWNAQMLALAQQARSLGATATQSWLSVILPAFKGLLGLCLFQTFLISWFEYGLTSLIGQGQVRTLPVLVFQFVQESSVAYAALASSLLMLPPLLLLVLNRRMLVRRVVEN